MDNRLTPELAISHAPLMIQLCPKATPTCFKQYTSPASSSSLAPLKPAQVLWAANTTTIAFHVCCLGLLPPAACWYMPGPKSAVCLWLAPISQPLFATDLYSTSHKFKNLFTLFGEALTADLLGFSEWHPSCWKDTKALLLYLEETGYKNPTNFLLASTKSGSWSSQKQRCLRRFLAPVSALPVQILGHCSDQKSWQAHRRQRPNCLGATCCVPYPTLYHGLLYKNSYLTLVVIKPLNFATYLLTELGAKDHDSLTLSDKLFSRWSEFLKINK